jgi:adenylate cyclase
VQRWSRGRHNRAYVWLFGLLYAATLLLAWIQPAELADLRNFVFDTYQRLDTPAYDPASPVRIVAIDEASLQKLGQWPWPRSRLAEIVDKLGALGASAVIFDVILAEPDRLSPENLLSGLPDGALTADLRQRLAAEEPNDVRFARAITGAPVALAVTATEQMPQGVAPPWPAKAGIATAGDPPDGFVPTFRSIILPIPVLRDAAGGLGATNWLPDHDQIVRRVPLLVRYGDTLVPSLALEGLRLAQGASTYVLRGSNASGFTAFGRRTGLNAIKVGAIEIGTGPDGSIRPRYTHAAWERYISAADLFAGAVAADQVRGRIILVGTPAIGLGDVRATPLDAAVPGVEIQAQVLEQLLAGKLLSRPDLAPSLETFVTLAFLTLLAVTLTRMSPALAALLSLAAMALLTAGSWLAFNRYALLLDPAFPSIVIGTAYLSGASALWEAELRAKSQVRRAFGKFVSPAVVARIAEHPHLLVLSGETRDLTILFSDVRSFSTICEGLTAPDVAAFLNAYLTPMTDVILQHDGTIDKYIGDAIVAFWNAPLDVPDHPRRAVTAALAMRAALDRFNNDPVAAGDIREKIPGHLGMGVGLNCGPCSVGNMGSLQRFDYSALGDPMNVSARLEALTKSYGVDILATGSVVARTPHFAWVEIDEVKVKGRSAATKLFTLFGDEAFAASDAFKAIAAGHAAMLQASRAARFSEATQALQALQDTAASRWLSLYANLAERYAEASDHPLRQAADATPPSAG